MWAINYPVDPDERETKKDIVNKLSEQYTTLTTLMRERDKETLWTSYVSNKLPCRPWWERDIKKDIVNKLCEQ